DGVYWVCLVVSNSSVPCQASWCDSIRVKGAPKPICSARFYHYSLAGRPDSVHFYTNTGSPTTKFSWTFGDGGTSTDRSPWHLYPNPGTYYVCLTVKDSTQGGTCTDTWCDSIRIEKPHAPICDAHFKFYPNPHNPDSIKFYPAAQGSSTRKYFWDFGDGGTSRDQYPWHLYADTGTYNVCLTVADS